MAEGFFKYVTRVAPYSDGSGYQATATVEHLDGQGVALRIEIIGELPIDRWAELRTEIDSLVTLAEKHPKT